MAVRIDKYIWCVRLAKTRSQASELVAKGKIKLNKTNVKPSKEINIGDVLSISKNSAVFEYKILANLDKRVGAKLVGEYLRDITPSTEIEKSKLYKQAQAQYRNNGTGKPTSKDRRDLDSFFSWQDEE
ncbi:MAG: S4 domain-containing protein [Bacteroidetes bacterium]|nr:S4 domain-containing protein [Bacteroidota bacterium]